MSLTAKTQCRWLDFFRADIRICVCVYTFLLTLTGCLLPMLSVFFLFVSANIQLSILRNSPVYSFIMK